MRLHSGQHIRCDKLVFFIFLDLRPYSLPMYWYEISTFINSTATKLPKTVEEINASPTILCFLATNLVLNLRAWWSNANTFLSFRSNQRLFLPRVVAGLPLKTNSIKKSGCLPALLHSYSFGKDWENRMLGNGPAVLVPCYQTSESRFPELDLIDLSTVICNLPLW